MTDITERDKNELARLFAEVQATEAQEVLRVSLTRKYLAALGIEAEKIDEIITAHAESLEAVKADRDKYKAQVEDEKGNVESKASELASVQKELDDLKKQVEADAKNREGKDYDKLLEEYNGYKAEQEAKAARSAKETALKELLADMKMSDKGSKQVLKWMGVDKIELDDDGKIKDAGTLRKNIKEDWGDYIQTQGTQGAQTPNPPGGTNGGATGKTKAEIMRIKDAKERQQAIADNPALFGLPTGE